MGSAREDHMRRAIAMSRRAIRTNRGFPFGAVDRRRVRPSHPPGDEAVTVFDEWNERPDKVTY